MVKKKGKDDGGVLFRGPDGNLYFISGSQLTKHKLTPAQRTCVETCLQKRLIECIQDCTVSSSDSASASDSVLISSKHSRRRRRAG